MVDPNAIYDILVEDCGANEDGRDDFVFSFLHDRERVWDTEYRFGGALGFGGKLHYQDRSIAGPSTEYRCFVSCYSEDKTPERAAMIHLANSKLRHPALKDA